VGRFVTTDVACADAPARLEAAIVNVISAKVDYSSKPEACE
jgi:hypothetical protein